MLWALLLTPPSVIALCNLFLNQRADAPAISLAIAPIALMACTANIAKLLHQRYRGRSRVMLVVFYIFGELVVCLATWLGTWLAVDEGACIEFMRTFA